VRDSVSRKTVPRHTLQVYFAARPMKFGSKQIEWEASEEPFGPRGSMVRRGVIRRLRADGGVEFSDGASAEKVDVVVYATGYHYSFPFLEASRVVSVEDNRQVAALRKGWPLWREWSLEIRLLHTVSPSFP